MSENYVSAQKGSIQVDGDYIIVKNSNRILHKCPSKLWSSLVHACKVGDRVITQKDLCDMFNIKEDRYYVTAGVVKRIIRQVII